MHRHRETRGSASQRPWRRLNGAFRRASIHPTCYLDTIEAQVQRIAENPMLGTDAELPRPGLRKIVAGRHTIFYLADNREVQIVRIMGQQQDHWNAQALR